MIVFDTETTGLPLTEHAPLSSQPKIIEIACIKLDFNLKEVERFDALVNPEMPIPKAASAVNNISDEDVKARVFGYGPNQWPSIRDAFKSALLNYHTSMLEFGKKIFESFALALELPINHFESEITKSMAHMKVLHYPPQDPKSGSDQMGIGAHSDYECFTILCTSDVPALQVLNTDGIWI